MLKKIMITGLAALAGTAAAATLAVAGGTSVTQVTTVAAKPSPERQAPPAAPTLSRTPAWLRESFALFRGTRNRGAVPVRAFTRSSVAQFGLNLRLGRRVAMGDRALYVVPGSKGVCLDAGPVTACGTRGQLTRRGILALYSCLPGSGDATGIFALVPDAVTRLDIALADGGTVEAAPTRNLVAVATATAPTAMTWRGTSTAAEPIDDAGGC
ncbi:MAG TPA: hypothetical protein VGW10_17020 [Solirubrobacteraceae bacterium]|nr:hypothetical protein [Solirubrobacteraceae bacterium]